MISLLATIAGFLSSLFPEFFKLIRDKNDKAHELQIMDRQIELEKSKISIRNQEILADIDTTETKELYRTFYSNIKFIDALTASVRPIIAYGFFILYVSIKLMQFSLIDSAHPLAIQLDILWHEEDQAIFAGIISFYYGQRSMNRYRGAK